MVPMDFDSTGFLRIPMDSLGFYGFLGIPEGSPRNSDGLRWISRDSQGFPRNPNDSFLRIP
eukprot:4777125-Pyramimonas_sp.AAC.1